MKVNLRVILSMVWGETWRLVWEWGSFATVISGAPSASLAESGSSALPGLRALLSTNPVVGLGDGAVLVVWSSGSVLSIVSGPEGLTVIVVLSSGWDVSVGKSNSWWGSGKSDQLRVVVVSSGNSGDKGSKGEFHYL